MKNIHEYLDKTKNRAWILFPPLILCCIGMGFVFANAISNIQIPKMVPVGYLISTNWLLIGLFIVLWSDNKKNKIIYCGKNR